MQQPFVDERSGNDGKGFYIRTFTGKKLYWDHVEDHNYDITDIAHALSMRVRWSGHVREFYSVAQHSVAVARQVEPEHRLAALLHDAAEAYITDFPSPLKWYLRDKNFTAVSEIEKKIEHAIALKFGIPPVRHPSIKQADLVLLSTENRDLMPAGEERLGMIPPLDQHIFGWTPDLANRVFLRDYREYTR